ncbi:MAG: type II secretion system F family protein [Actinomycetota bacterium]
MTKQRRRRAVACVAVLLAVVVGAQTAFAQSPAVVVKIRQAALDGDGATRVVVSVTGDVPATPLGAANFAIKEDGKDVSSLDVKPLFETKTTAVAVALAMDISGSTIGKPLADAKVAAKSFIGRLPAAVRVAVIAFGPTASVRTGLTTDRNRLSQTIDGLVANGDTALYDGAVLASRVLGQAQAQRNIVIFSDGKDTVSRATLAQAVSAAKGVAAPVTTVGLQTSEFDAASLNKLANDTGGRTVSVSQSAQLASAFQQVAQSISNQYVLTYTSATPGPKDVNLQVTLLVGATQASDAIAASRPERGVVASADATPAPSRPVPSKPLVSAFGSDAGLLVGLVAAFLAVAFFFGMIFWQPESTPAMKVLRRGLSIYERSDKRKGRKDEPETGIASTAFGRRAAEVIERVPRSQEYQTRVQTKLDRAGWPLRSTEFVLMQIGGVIVGAALGFGLFRTWWLGLILLVAGPMIPTLILQFRIDRRQGAFVEQLPDTLQLLAGSLQAGYGFLQALDTLVKEAQEPTASEFSLVLSETRLGMGVEDAMNGMAERMGSEDFRWVVLAINIQRQVGGNLAQLLTTVANTLREREQLRRQIKVLSAEGKLSAIILTALPFALAGYIALVNPTYLHALTSETIGKIMIAGSIFLMGVGGLWMRKLIRIDV